MINPFTGIPSIEKSIDSEDKLELLEDDKWLFELASKLNIPGGGGGPSINTTDDLPEGTTNLYSQWEVNAYVTNFLQPKTTTNGLVIGNDVDSSVTTAFNGISAIFNGDTAASNGGLNYFANFSYGTSGVAFGSLFLGGRARGTSSAPTQIMAGDFITGLVSTAYDDAGDWALGNNHLLPGLYMQAATNVTAGAYEANVWLGGLLSPMIGFETDTNAIIFNQAAVDSNITFYSDSATTLVLDGGNTQALFYAGSAANPSIAFQDNIDTGFRYQGPFFSPTYIMAVIDGTDRMRITEDSVRFRDGSATNVAIGFISSSGALDACIDGFYRLGSNNIGVSINATAVMDWDTNSLNIASGYSLIWATDTNLYRSAANTLKTDDNLIVAAAGTAANSVATIDATQTLTNKRRTLRTATTNAPGATPTTNSDNVDVQEFTGLNAAITSMTTNLSGTPSNNDLLEFKLVDDGTARAITWGSSFAASGTVALPTTTVISTELRVLFQYSTTGSLNKWVCIAVS